jgi:hypothetical protein
MEDLKKEFFCDHCLSSFEGGEFVGHCPVCGESDKIFPLQKGPENFFQPAIVHCEGCENLYPVMSAIFMACVICGAGLSKIHTFSTTS